LVDREIKDYTQFANFINTKIKNAIGISVEVDESELKDQDTVSEVRGIRSHYEYLWKGTANTLGTVLIRDQPCYCSICRENSNTVSLEKQIPCTNSKKTGKWQQQIQSRTGSRDLQKYQSRGEMAQQKEKSKKSDQQEKNVTKKKRKL